MLSKERAYKKTKLGKQYRKIQKKKVKKAGTDQGKEQKKEKQGKTQKAVEKVKKNGYESFGSDENVDDQYKKTKAMSR